MSSNKNSHRVCEYYQNLQYAIKDLTFDPIDIEDLAKQGSEKQYCPYYAQMKR